MKVQLEKTFDLPGSAEAAWAVLCDIERVASCMPGARITERVDATHYKGTVAVKFGPANMSFRGEVEVLGLDAGARSLRLVGKGTDNTSGSGASMDLDAHIEAVDGATSRLVGRSEVSMSGKAAAFGARLAQSVADQVLKQFVANFGAQVQAVQAAPPAVGPPATGGGGGSGGAAPASPSAAPLSPAPAAAPLNAFALGWAIFKDWLRSLFGPRKA